MGMRDGVGADRPSRCGHGSELAGGKATGAADPAADHEDRGRKVARAQERPGQRIVVTPAVVESDEHGRAWQLLARLQPAREFIRADAPVSGPGEIIELSGKVPRCDRGNGAGRPGGDPVVSQDQERLGPRSRKENPSAEQE